MNEHDRRFQKPHSQALMRAYADDKISAQEMAFISGRNERQPLRWMQNEATIPLWLARLVYEETGDVELFASITGATELGLIVSEAPPSHDADSLVRAALRVGADAGAVQRLIDKALSEDSPEGTSLSEAEKAKISREVDRAQRVLQSLKLALHQESAPRCPVHGEVA